MPLRVTNQCEKDVLNSAVAPIVIPDSKSTLVLPKLASVPGQEFCGRYIQNVGANDLYYSFGADAAPNNLNGILGKAGSTDANGLGAGQQLDCSNHGDSVYVYSIGGTTVAVTLLVRNDLIQHTNIIGQIP